MKKKGHGEYQGFGAAGIRLTEAPLPDIVVHSSEHELPVLYACHMFDKAHLVMLAEEDIIPPGDAALMLASLREMEDKGIEKVRLEVGGGIHSGEHYLIKRLSEEIGGRIHLGRSSGDIDRVADRITYRDKLLEVMASVNACRRVLLQVAGQHVRTVMPGYTHAQHAQPITLGHQLLAWTLVLARDFQRLASALSRINASPAGAAIMTGSNFPLNRRRTAELLGFEKPCENTFDAIHSPDDFLEVFSVIALLHANIARWADDLILWSSTDVGMVDLPDRFCGTSSILAQKKNPYALEHIRGAAAHTVGGLMTAFLGEKGPSGLAIFSRNRYSKQILLGAFDNVLRDLGWLTELLSNLGVNRERMKQLAGAFWAQATDVAGAIVREKGLSWRTAHQIVGTLVRLSQARGIAPQDVDTALLDEAAVQYLGEPIGLSQGSLRSALDPLEFVKGRTLYGGPAPGQARRRIAEFAEILDRDKEAVTEIRKKLQRASRKLERAIDRIIRNHLFSSGPG